jgi:methylglyoxal/glyoxal reductase
MENPHLEGLYSSFVTGLKSVTTLNNGAKMPWLGLGVFKMNSDDETTRAVRVAIDLGYRHIDTAMIYRNERGVGRAIRECGVPREELFITTKAWNDDIRANRIDAACDESLGLLGLDYLDLYLLHWPINGHHAEAWRAMETIHRSGRARSIGLSNYMIPHLEEIKATAEIQPAVNQIEFHPYLQSPALCDYCRNHGIQLTAWSPLMHGGELLQDPVLQGIAARHGKTVAQVILRWNLQFGVTTIPKSTQPSRILENASVFDFALDAADMQAMAALDAGRRNGPDPLNFNF